MGCLTLNEEVALTSFLYVETSATSILDLKPHEVTSRADTVLNQYAIEMFRKLEATNSYVKVKVR